jgi:hypothetical protein
MRNLGGSMPATLEIVVPLLSAERKPPVLFGNIGLPAGLLDTRKRSDCDNHIYKIAILTLHTSAHGASEKGLWLDERGAAG